MGRPHEDSSAGWRSCGLSTKAISMMASVAGSVPVVRAFSALSILVTCRLGEGELGGGSMRATMKAMLACLALAIGATQALADAKRDCDQERDLDLSTAPVPTSFSATPAQHGPASSAGA